MFGLPDLLKRPILRTLIRLAGQLVTHIRLLAADRSDHKMTGVTWKLRTEWILFDSVCISMIWFAARSEFITVRWTDLQVPPDVLRGCIKKVLNMQTQHVDQKWGIIVPTTSLPVLPSIFPEFYVRWSLRPPRLHRFELDLNEGKMLERRQVPLKDQWLVNKESIRTCTTQTRHQCVNWIKLYLLFYLHKTTMFFKSTQ